MIATIGALIWANSPFGEGYESFWRTELRLSVGDLELTEDLRHWINDALMVLFFFVVGLEIKRELVTGELNSRRKAMLPVVAALGGMVVPALLYLAFNAGGSGSDGWGIPMATDIAFAVGVLSLLGDRVPSGLKVFLLSLAIVDDIGAILVIALFYSGGIDPSWLGVAGGALVSIVVLRRWGVLWLPVYVALGVVVWLATYESGVHATIAGVVLGLLTPGRPSDEGGYDDVLKQANALSSDPDAESLHSISVQAKEVVSVGERLEYVLHPWTSYVVVPLFALANAGVVFSSEALRDALGSRVGLGILTGLIIGKVVGISGASWIAIRGGLGQQPEGVSLRHLVGGAALAGIGFTVSLFITSLAFDNSATVTTAKIAVFGASIIAGVLGSAILLQRSRVQTDVADPDV